MQLKEHRIKIIISAILYSIAVSVFIVATDGTPVADTGVVTEVLIYLLPSLYIILFALAWRAFALQKPSTSKGVSISGVYRLTFNFIALPIAIFLFLTTPIFAFVEIGRALR